mmetsp:Transcript_14717/g.33631  ORF Transcript_14717/g.33631 Transcript_14717/m.33631 type:complete len:203 (-) Transcript_14717:76-684(-)
MQQQMQVVIPQGITPGMTFQVNTPAGMMQVICPDGAYAGGSMLVNVPVAAAPPIVMGAPVPVDTVMPPQQQMGMAMAQPMAQPMVMAPQGVVPVNNTMARGPMDNRMHEVSSGCYYQKNLPCCNAMYYSFQEDNSVYRIGPAYCCVICCWPCPPGCCGNQRAVSPGSSVYKGNAGEDVWQSPTMFTRTNAEVSQKDEPFVKC